jgi:hypothetical protein
MMGRKTLGEIRVELEAALGRGAALRSGHGEVTESLRRFLGRESSSAANAGPDEERVATRTAKPTPAGPPPRRDGRRGGSATGGRRRA